MAAASAAATAAAAFVASSILILAALCPTPTSAWGGVFNRFSPEMLTNLGYGGAHGASHRVSPFMQHYQAPDAFQELVNADSDPEEPCIGRKCTANEHCCPGNVCVYVEGSYGTCLFDYGSRQGEHCQRDNDCETGLQCTEVAGVAGRVCNPPNVSRKQYSEECMVSSECDIHKGLCCQFQRRHRQAPRKVCSYFKDPLICVGPVATDQVKLLGIEHTAGEKRLTGQAAGAPFNHIRK